MKGFPKFPPVPECPGFSRHHFAGSRWCRRPDCRRPQRLWRDYTLSYDPLFKRLLNLWLSGELDDQGLFQALVDRYRTVSEPDRLMSTWKATRDGLDLPAPLFISLWESDQGPLRLGLNGTNHAAIPRSLFHLDVQAIAAGELASHAVKAGWPHGMTRVAEWCGDAGPRLLGAPGPAACRYLGIEHPARWLTTGEAAEVLGYTQAHTAWLARQGLIGSRKPVRDYELDPVQVEWRAARRTMSMKEEA